jgi:hypothetical protein
MHESPATSGPLPNRFTRATALGCLGIVAVLALPGLLFLPLEDWHLPKWALLLLVLFAFATLGFGVWLLARVPGSAIARSTDARQPLTHAGRAPVMERPATTANRVVLVVLLALGVLALTGYVVASVAAQVAVFGASVALVGATGLCGLTLGVTIAVGRMPGPAWNWARTPIAGPVRSQGLAIALLGAAVTAWALLAATGAGYLWAALGLEALLLLSVVVALLARRGRPAPRLGADGESRRRSSPSVSNEEEGGMSPTVDREDLDQ